VRVLILSGKPGAFSVRRLDAAFRAGGHEVEILDPFDLCISFDHTGGAVLHDGRPVAADLVIPRLSARSATPYTLALLRQLEAQGVIALNGANAIEIARDKLRSLQALAAAQVAVPRTLVLAKKEHLVHTLASIGGVPAVVKLLHGTQGIGVMLAESEEALVTLLNALWSMREDSIVQRFVRESSGRDVRALVVGGRVVAAMRRTAREGDFRANLHRGGGGEALTLDAASNDMALRAANVLGLEVAGVDLLEANGRPLVLEVNTSPGLEGIEAASGRDVAREIKDHAESVVRSRRAR